MTNKDFRRRAWELCREKFGVILRATFFMSLISWLGMQLAYLMDAPLFSSLISILLTAISIVISIGMVRFILDIWHGETPTLAVLFSQKHRIWTYICYVLLVGLIGLIVYFAAMMLFGIIGAMVQLEAVVFIGMMVSLIPMLWLVLRFEMALVCAVLRPSYGAIDCMRTAWRASKGKAWRLFCNEFVLYLPLMLAQILLYGYQLYLMYTGQTLNVVGSLLLDIASMTITALLSGYIYLGTYSLHEHLLNECSYVPPRQQTGCSIAPETLSLEEAECEDTDDEDEPTSPEN